jgi:hypothetical protein
MKHKGFLISILVALAGLQHAYAYTPPIGIPDPGQEWGSLHPIDTLAPTAPQPWNQAVNGFYYVEPTHANATDSGNTYGYPDQPRATVPSVLAPGSYVELHGSFSSPISVTASCDESNPCWLRGESIDSRPNNRSMLTIRDSKFLFVENLDFNGGTGGAIRIFGASNNVVVRDSRLINREQPTGNSAGIVMLPDTGDLIENIVVYNNHFETLGDYTVAEDLDFHAVLPSLWGRDSSTELRKVFILENYCTLLSGDCVQVNAGNWEQSYNYLHHIYIGKNFSFKNRQTGFAVKQASDIIISQNKSSGSYGASTTSNGGGAILYQYAKHRLWIIFNELYDSVFGIRQSDTSTPTTEGYSNIYIIGNLIYDIHPSNLSTYNPANIWDPGVGIALWHGNATRYIIDNTIHDVHDGLNAIQGGRGGIEMYGNIISQKDDNISNRFFDIQHPAREDSVNMDNNLFLDDVGEYYYAWWDDMGHAPTLDEVKSYGHCLNCQSIIGEDGTGVFVNPTIDSSTHDFRPKSTSAAVTENVKHSAYDRFQDLYGIDIYVDFNGNPRNGSAIGAFESVSASNNPVLSPPSAPILQVD